MKVLDPQSALLTTSEVYEFLLENPPRPPQRKIGSYAPVNLKNYQRIREDFLEYISRTVPYIAKYPSPETFVKNVVPKLRAFGLAKTEVFMMINLGLGLPREQQLTNGDHGADGVDENADEAEASNAGNQGESSQQDEEGEASYEAADTDLLSRVVEELYERFPGDEGQEQIRKMLETMKEEYGHAQAAQATTNGDTNLHRDAMDVS